MPTKKDKEWVSKEQNTAFLRAALDNYHLPPIDISDPKEVSIRIEEYFQRCEQNGIRPVVTGICNSIGIDRKTFLKWANGIQGSPDHQLTARRALSLCEELMEAYMTNSQIHPVTGMFLMTNNFAGWQNHAERNPMDYKPQIGTSEEALRRRYITASVTPPVPVAAELVPSSTQKKAGDD